jgi:tetratricopeptide (TPR) repeat protein
LAEKGQYDIAIKCLNGAFNSLDSSATTEDKENIMIRIGNYYKKCKKSDEAIISYIKAMNINPSSSLPYCALGQIYYNLKEYQKSIDNCSIAIGLAAVEENNTTERFAYLYEGLSYAGLSKSQYGQFDKAIQCYNSAIELSPLNQEAYLTDIWGSLGSLSALEAHSSKNEDRMLQASCDDCEKSISLDPTCRYAWICRGDYNFSLGRYNEELSSGYMNSLLDFGKENYWRYKQYALMNFTNATKNYMRAIAIDENKNYWDASIFDKLSESELKTQNYAESNGASKEAAKLHSLYRPEEITNKEVSVLIKGTLQTTETLNNISGSDENKTKEIVTKKIPVILQGTLQTSGESRASEMQQAAVQIESQYAERNASVGQEVSAPMLD